MLMGPDLLFCFGNIPYSNNNSINDQKTLPHNTAEWKLYSESLSGNPPFNFLALYGGSLKHRGYTFGKYRDIHQEINFTLKDEFEKRGIEFAYPTQTLFMEKSEGNG